MKKSNVVFSALVCATSLVAASGCGMMKNMDEMHDSTVNMDSKMDQTNKGMEDTLKEMQEMKGITKDGMDKTNDKMDATLKKMEETNAIMCNVYQDGRQTSVDTRGRRFEAMEAQSAPEVKIAEAGVYFQSLEFQLFKAKRCPNETAYEALKRDAVKEFFREINRYGVRFHNINMSSKNSNDLNLAALSVALHEINSNAEAVAKESGTPKVTMLSLIEDALKNKPAIDRGDLQASLYEHELLMNTQDAIYLLQLRANFLGGMVLERLTHINELGKIGQGRRRYWGSYGVDLTADDSDGTLGLSEIQNYIEWIHEANRVRALLKSLGYATPTDSNLWQLLNRMSFGYTEINVRSSKKDKLHAAAEHELTAGIAKYLKN
jgi:hypothetical protein